MTDRTGWTVVERASDGSERLFFDAHEWGTVEEACERIYPADTYGPGAREARVIRFIDRYLAGLDFVFASADGKGFLAIEGKDADAWRMRIGRLQRTYREGIHRLDEMAQAAFGADFQALDAERQDRVLEKVSGAPKPTGIVIGETGEAHVQNISDDALPFFAALTLHTRQGLFCDPVYGGNHDRVGWKLIGFPGPTSLEATRDCSYGHPEKFLSDYDWADLIPHLRTARRTERQADAPTDG